MMKKREEFETDRIERLGNLYEKLKGTIFLRLAPQWIVGRVAEITKDTYYPMNIWGERDFEVCSSGIVVELRQDMTFAQFLMKWYQK